MDDLIDDIEMRLAMAEKAVEAISTATSLTDAKMAWVNFLTASHTIYQKLSVASRQYGEKAWFNEKLVIRESDELLNYLHKARNTDEHGLAPTVTKHNSYRVGDGVGGMTVTVPAPHTIWNISAIGYDGSLTPIDVDAQPTLRLAEVENGSEGRARRKVMLAPPKNHMGQEIHESMSAAEVGSLGLSYLRTLVAETKMRFS